MIKWHTPQAVEITVVIEYDASALSRSDVVEAVQRAVEPQLTGEFTHPQYVGLAS